MRLIAAPRSNEVPNEAATHWLASHRAPNSATRARRSPDPHAMRQAFPQGTQERLPGCRGRSVASARIAILARSISGLMWGLRGPHIASSFSTIQYLSALVNGSLID